LALQLPAGVGRASCGWRSGVPDGSAIVVNNDRTGRLSKHGNYGANGQN